MKLRGAAARLEDAAPAGVKIQYALFERKKKVFSSPDTLDCWFQALKKFLLSQE